MDFFPRRMCEKKEMVCVGLCTTLCPRAVRPPACLADDPLPPPVRVLGTGHRMAARTGPTACCRECCRGGCKYRRMKESIFLSFPNYWERGKGNIQIALGAESVRNSRSPHSLPSSSSTPCYDRPTYTISRLITKPCYNPH